MKFVFNIWIIFVLNIHINAQIITFVGASSGNILNWVEDTVTFGFIDGCTIGIDNKFGEEELSNKQIDSLELRIFQRDKAHYSCIIDTAGKALYYNNNIQLKKDFRSTSSKENELYFEVENLTNNFENGYMIYFRNYHSFNHRSTYLGFSAISECDEDRIDYFNLLEPVDSAFLLGIAVPKVNFSRPDLKDYKHFYFHLKVSEPLSTNEKNSDNSEFLVYPNPAGNTLTIESNNIINIYNLSGQLIFCLNSSDEKKILDLSLFPEGIYTIHTIDKYGKINKISKFVKGL